MINQIQISARVCIETPYSQNDKRAALATERCLAKGLTKDTKGPLSIQGRPHVDIAQMFGSLTTKPPIIICDNSVRKKIEHKTNKWNPKSRFRRENSRRKDQKVYSFRYISSKSWSGNRFHMYVAYHHISSKPYKYARFFPALYILRGFPLL